MERHEDNKKPRYTRFVIVVPTESDKKELQEAFHHIHNADIDTDLVPVNQLAHQYTDSNEIIVDRNLYRERAVHYPMEDQRNEIGELIHALKTHLDTADKRCMFVKCCFGDEFEDLDEASAISNQTLSASDGAHAIFHHFVRMRKAQQLTAKLNSTFGLDLVFTKYK